MSALKTYAFVFTLIFIFFAWPGLARGEAGGYPTDIHQIVRVYSPDSLCTGSLVRRDLVMTAAHCIDSKQMQAQFGNRVVIATRISVDPAYNGCQGMCAGDVAFIRIPRQTLTPLQIDVEQPGFAISYGYGEMANGTLAVKLQGLAFNIVNVASQFMATGSGYLGSGDSGGPIVQNGKVVGINDESSGMYGQPSYFMGFDQWTWNFYAKDGR